MTSHLVFVTVGTDYHPFDRLIAWMDAWLADHRDLRCILQTGTSRTPTRGQAQPYLSHHEVERLLREARVVVTHGGAATMSLCSRFNKRPIVVPRLPQLGEIVDDHQTHFARRLADEGLIDLAWDEGTFRSLLVRALAGGRPPTPLARPTPASVARVGRILEGLRSGRNATETPVGDGRGRDLAPLRQHGSLPRR